MLVAISNQSNPQNCPMSIFDRPIVAAPPTKLSPPTVFVVGFVYVLQMTIYLLSKNVTRTKPMVPNYLV